jgi:acetyltransferase
MRPDSDPYRAPFRLRDGREVVVRRLRPEDEPLIVAFHAGHSEHTLRMRFFGLVKVLTHESLVRLCHLDDAQALALVAEHRDASGPRLWGVARYHLDSPTGVAEFALVVGDAWQRQGLGRHLLGRLIAAARERGVRRLVGQILSENRPMLSLVTSVGFRPAPSEEGIVVVGLDLDGESAQSGT